MDISSRPAELANNTTEGKHREEYIIEAPTLCFDYTRDGRGRHTGYVSTPTLPPPLGADLGPGNVRPRAHATATFRSRQGPRPSEPGAEVDRDAPGLRNADSTEYDRDGRIILVRASNYHYALDPDVLRGAQEGDARGFVLRELRARSRGDGRAPVMEASVRRPLGKAIACLLEFYNKSGLLPLAIQDMLGECMQRQLQLALANRELHFHPRTADGQRELASDEKVQEFTFPELTKYGGVIDQAPLRLPGVAGSVHDHRKPQDHDDVVER